MQIVKVQKPKKENETYLREWRAGRESREATAWPPTVSAAGKVRSPE